MFRFENPTLTLDLFASMLLSKGQHGHFGVLVPCLSTNAEKTKPEIWRDVHAKRRRNHPGFCVVLAPCARRRMAIVEWKAACRVNSSDFWSKLPQHGIDNSVCRCLQSRFWIFPHPIAGFQEFCQLISTHSWIPRFSSKVEALYDAEIDSVLTGMLQPQSFERDSEILEIARAFSAFFCFLF